MRQIKFRAWDVADKRMVWHDYIWNEWWYGSPQGGNGKAVYFNDNRTINERLIAGFHLMQFTGLLDKNGKEIWEGDILATKDVPNVIVKFGETETWIGWYCEYVRKEGGTCHFNSTINHTSEVIGNIYENPELLSGSE